MASLYNPFTEMVQRVGAVQQAVLIVLGDISAHHTPQECIEAAINEYHAQLATLCIEFGIWPDEYEANLVAKTSHKWAYKSGFSMHNVEGVFLSLEKIARTQSNGLFRRVVRERLAEWGK